MQTYLSLFCDIDSVKLEEELMSFARLLVELDRFKVNGLALGQLLNKGIREISLTPDIVEDNKIKIEFEEDGYYCNCALGDILDTCILLLSKGKALRCDTVGSGELYEYFHGLFPFMFSMSSYSVIPQYFKGTIIISKDFSLELNRDILKGIYWERIEKVILSETISTRDFLKEIKIYNAVILSKDNTSVSKKSIEEELESLDSEYISMDDVLIDFNDRLKEFGKNCLLFNQMSKNVPFSAYVNIRKNIESRYELVLEIYAKLCELGKDKKYLFINFNTTNVYILELIASLCAVYCNFNGVKAIMDEQHAGYTFFEKTIFELNRGNFIPPYLGYKRLLGIRRDLNNLDYSSIQPVLRKGGRSNLVVSYPLGMTNSKPVYLFPLNMFISYSEDIKLSAVPANNRPCLITVPRNKDISISIKDGKLDDLSMYESVKLFSMTKPLSDKLSDDAIDYLKGALGSEELANEFMQSVLVSDMLDYLDSGEISFEGGNGKLVLHDWILNPTVEAIDVVKNYLNSIFTLPNSEQEESYNSENFQNLLIKILGFSSEDEIDSIYDVTEWSTDVTSVVHNTDGATMSKSTFASTNYEHSEFYNSVCEMITSVLASSSESQEYKYVTIHDLMLATANIDGQEKIFVAYCPMKPEMLWYVNETGEFPCNTIEKGNMSCLTSNLVNLGSNDNELRFFFESINNMYSAQFDPINDLRDDDPYRVIAYDQLSKIFNFVSDKSGGFDLNSLSESDSVFDLYKYFSEDELEFCKKLALWFISTKFIGFNCSIPTLFPVKDSELPISRSVYKFSTLQYLYSNYYDVLGYENLEELENIISPQKHLKYCRVVSPYGGILRSEAFMLNPELGRVFCTTPNPGVFDSYQYVNSRFITE